MKFFTELLGKLSVSSTEDDSKSDVEDVFTDDAEQITRTFSFSRRKTLACTRNRSSANLLENARSTGEHYTGTRRYTSPNLERSVSEFRTTTTRKLWSDSSFIDIVKNKILAGTTGDNDDDVASNDEAKSSVSDVIVDKVRMLKRTVSLHRRRSLKSAGRRASTVSYRTKYSTTVLHNNQRRHTSPCLGDTKRNSKISTEGSVFDFVKNKITSRFRGKEGSVTERVATIIADRRKAMEGLSRDDTVSYFRAKYGK